MRIPRDAIKTHAIKDLMLSGAIVWAATSIIYTALSWGIELFSREFVRVIFCGLFSVTLSIIMIALFSDFKVKKEAKSILNLALYSLILYFFSNGIQAFYSSIQRPTDKQIVSKAELVPIFSAHPWLPPSGMKNKLVENSINIQALEQSSVELETSLDSTSLLLESCGLMTDSIFLTAIPQARELAAGGTYRSDVVLAAKLDKSYVKKVSVNNREIPLENGVAVYEEPTSKSGTNYLNYRAEIELYGQTKMIEVDDSYKVINPYIEVSSQAVNALFLNCGNQLSFQVPILGGDYQPKFQVDGAEYRLGKKPGFITIVPNSREVGVTVYNQGTKLGYRQFPVRRVPAPEVIPIIKGRTVDVESGIAKNTPSISFKVESDDDFARLLPKDASYKVQTCEISLISRGIFKRKIKGSSTSNISSLVRGAQKGDQLKVEINQVLRRNFKGDIENVKDFYPKFFLISLK